MHLPAIDDRLNREEAKVLVQLCRALIRADGHISDDELLVMRDLAHAVGLDVFADAVEHLDAPRLTDTMLRALAGRVRTENQELVLLILFELAAADGLVEPERALLGRLADTWGLDEPTVT